MIRAAIAWLALLPALAAGATGPSTGAGDTFPEPGEYANAYCRLEFQQGGRFEMRGMDCSYPWHMTDGSITTSASGWARIRAGHLLLDFNQEWENPDLEFLVIPCSLGPRFLPPEEQRDFALALHSQNAYDLRWRSGFAATGDRDRIDFECDLSPLPSGLLRIAQAPPIRAKIHSVTTSKCDHDGANVRCEATLVMDRGEAHGLVPGMDLYFPDCAGVDYSLSVESVRAKTAIVDFGWDPAAETHASRYLGTEVTTRMPACLITERARLEQRALERNEQEQAEESE